MALTKLTDGVRGTITNAQISDLPTSKLTGTVSDAQIAAMASSKLSGTLSDSQIAGMTSSKLTGALPAIDGSNLTGVASDISNLQTNIALNFFLDAVDHARSIQNLQDGWTDQFEDQTGVDDTNSINESYDATNDYYTPAKAANIVQNVGTDDWALGDISGTTYIIGQSFTIPVTSSITQVDIRYGTKYASPTGNLTIKIETDNNNNPSGTLAHANATKTLTPPGSPDDQTQAFTFPGAFTITGNTKYWLVADVPGTGGTNARWSLHHSASANPYADGEITAAHAGVWQTPIAARDLWMTIYVTAVTGNMTLMAEPVVALAAPAKAHVTLFKQDVDAVTLNTDLLAWVSRSKQTVTSDFGTDEKLDATGHGLVNTDRVIVTSSAGDVPAGLSQDVVYFVVNKTTNDFEVSLSSGGSAVNITDNGTGTHSVHAVTAVTLVDEGTYSSYDIIAGAVDISAQPSDTDMVLFLQTANNKDMKIHGQSLQWED